MQWDNSKFAFRKLEQDVDEIKMFIRGGGHFVGRKFGL